MKESKYESKLKKLKKEESDFIKCRSKIDPVELGKMVSLGISIDMVKDVLNKRK